MIKTNKEKLIELLNDGDSANVDDVVRYFNCPYDTKDNRAGCFETSLRPNKLNCADCIKDWFQKKVVV